METVLQLAQSLRSDGTERTSLPLRVAETGTSHLLGGAMESSGTYIVHLEKLECLGQGHALGSGPQELDMRRHFSEDRIKSHFAQSSFGNGSLRKHGRTSGQGKALDHADKFLGIDGEKGPFVVGHTDARRTFDPSGFLGFSRHYLQLTAGQGWVNVTSVCRALPGCAWPDSRGRLSPRGLSVHELGEHFVGIDSDEEAFAVGQHFAPGIEDFGFVGVIAAAHANLPRFHA